MAVKWGGRGRGHTSRVVVPGEFAGGGEPEPDTTAPILSSPTDAADGSDGATLAVTTDEANGTLYWFVSTSATPPSAANLKAGTGATEYGSQAVTGTGVQNVGVATGLLPETEYFAHFLHRDAAGNDSSIATADGFTTTPLSAPVATLTSDPGEVPAVTITYGSDIYPTYYLQIQRSADGIGDADGYTTPTLDILHVFTTEEAGRGELNNADLTADGYTDPGLGLYYQQYRWARETGEVVLGEPVLVYSDWSNEITDTVVSGATLPTTGLILQLDADDLSTLYQTVDGTTTAVAANDDPVGYWADKSGNGFHLSAAGNDTTRPLYKANGGLPFVEFDGSNDILRRLAALGLWSGGACTVAIALRSNATPSAANLGIFMEGSSTDNDPVYALTTVGSNDDVKLFLRNDTNNLITISSSESVLLTGLDANDAVITFTDDGANLIAYDDGVSPATRTYTRGANTLTLNRFAIGGWQRATPAVWFGMKVFAVAAWSRVLDGAERAEVLTYMAAKQGRTL